MQDLSTPHVQIKTENGLVGHSVRIHVSLDLSLSEHKGLLLQLETAPGIEFIRLVGI